MRGGTLIVCEEITACAAADGGTDSQIKVTQTPREATSHDKRAGFPSGSALELHEFACKKSADAGRKHLIMCEGAVSGGAGSDVHRRQVLCTASSLRLQRWSMISRNYMVVIFMCVTTASVHGRCQ